MKDIVVEFKTGGWINPFSIAGGVIGYWKDSTWMGGLCGFGIGLMVPFTLIMIAYLAITIAESLDTVFRVQTIQPLPEQPVIAEVPTYSQEWDEAYRQYCQDNDLTNELDATHSPVNRESYLG